MPKPSQSGTQTVTQVNPTQQAQTPFLQGGWEAAQNLYDSNSMQPYPGQTLATPNPWISQGYNNLGNTATANESIRAAANNPFFAATSGQYGVQSSPAYGGLVDIRSDATRPQQDLIGNTRTLSGIGDQAMGIGNYGNAQLQNTALAAGGAGNYYGGQLNNVAAGVPGATATPLGYMNQTASGAYVGANPYLDDTYAAAADATTRAYQTATAPRTDSSYEAAGRYGSPSYSNAVSQNEQNLGSTLGNLSADIYGTAYSQERALQEEAARSMGALGISTAETQGNLYNQAGTQSLQGLSQQAAAQQAGSNLGLSGLNTATTANTNAGQLNVADAALINDALKTMQTGYQTGNQQALSASALSPSLIQNGITNADTMVRAGQGLTGLDQAQINDQVQRYNAQMMAPYNQLDTYLRQIGQPTTGSATTQQPIYSDPLGSALGMTGAANSMFGNPLGAATAGLFGSAAPIGASAVAGGAPAVLAPSLTASGLSSLAAMNTGATAASMAAPATAAMWIICTELTRQGRMPIKHWAVGSRVFAGYPARGQRGYFVWAIPAVRHLRRKPNSLLSRTLATIFRWRAEDLAARAGVKGARKLWRGRAVTAVLWVPCLALGYLVPEQDWKQVYRDARP